jgi:rare lipoprotein A
MPFFLLLAGCGGVGLGNNGDDPQLPPAPARPAESASAAAPEAPPVAPAFGPQPQLRPGAGYAPPAAEASAEARTPAGQALPDEANSYRTADGVVHMLPRGRSAPARPEPPVQTAQRAPAIQHAPEPVRAAPAVAAEGGPPPTAGPQGSSEQAAGEERYDTVGYAGVRGVAGNNAATANSIVAVHPTLPAGTIVEVTSLDTGRTILVLVTATMPVPPDHLIDLSTGAAHLLGGDAGGKLAVRVRKVIATPQDQNLLRSGQSASERIDAPAALVSALRRRLGVSAAPVLATTTAPTPVALPPSRVATTDRGANYPAPARVATPRPKPPVSSGGYFLQVAAVSTPARAQALAHNLGGSVRPAGNLYKVQVGPYASAGEAEHAKSQLAARGYGGAMIVRLP